MNKDEMKGIVKEQGIYGNLDIGENPSFIPLEEMGTKVKIDKEEDEQDKDLQK